MYKRKTIFRFISILTCQIFIASAIFLNPPQIFAQEDSHLAPPSLLGKKDLGQGTRLGTVTKLFPLVEDTESSTALGPVLITLGNLSSKVTSISEENNKIVLTNTANHQLSIELLSYGGNYCLRIGSASYIIRDFLQAIDISAINPLGNDAYLNFFDLKLEEIPSQNFSFALPVDEPQKLKLADLFPANSVQQAKLLSDKVEQGVFDKAKAYVINIYGSKEIRAPLFELLHNIAITAISGGWRDYYLAQDVLNRLIKDNLYEQNRDTIIGLADYLYFIYVGCDWLKWQDIGKEIRSQKSVTGASETKAGRTRTLFELSIDPARLPVSDPENWEIISVDALDDKEVDYLYDSDKYETVRLGKEAIGAAQVASILFCGGAATTVKKLIGMHKLVHKALKVIVEKADKRLIKWISIVQARIGIIFGQNPNSKIVLVTSVGGTEEGESDRSIRESLAVQYADEVDRGQIPIAMQRTGLVLDINTGYPLRFPDGHVATCAENHLWALLALLMDKMRMMYLLENTESILSAGNGDNILNYPREGMIGMIRKARLEHKPLATVSLCAPSAGDKKGGFAAKVTYRHKKTGETIIQKELREISEFPTRSEKQTGFKAIDLSNEQEASFYTMCEKNGWFIEDIFGNKRVAFNVAFYAVDGRLIIARIFGLDENDPELIAKLNQIDQDAWSAKILALARQVTASKIPSKKVPSENGTFNAVGYITEQMVQDFIVNGLGLLANEKLPNPEADMLLANRGDTFLPYKGTDQQELDIRGDPIATSKPKYDLIANQARYSGVVTELKDRRQRIELGESGRVTEVVPVKSLDQVILVNQDKYLDYDYSAILDEVVKSGPTKVIVISPDMIGETLGFKEYIDNLIFNTNGKVKIIIDGSRIPDNKMNDFLALTGLRLDDPNYQITRGGVDVDTLRKLALEKTTSNQDDDIVVVGAEDYMGGWYNYANIRKLLVKSANEDSANLGIIPAAISIALGIYIENITPAGNSNTYVLIPTNVPKSYGEQLKSYKESLTNI